MLHPGKDEFDGWVDDYDDKVKHFGVPGRLREFGDALMSTFQRWRAGIEGTISCLKRVFRLSRCHFKGFYIRLKVGLDFSAPVGRCVIGE